MEKKDERLMEDTVAKAGEVTAAGTSKISRREFARRAAVASAVASIAPGHLGARTASEREERSADDGARAGERAGVSPGIASAQEANAPKVSPAGQIEAEARYQTIMSEYGSRFSEEQKADIHRLCLAAQAPLERLRAYAVENGDGPALYLKPLMEREKKAAPASASKNTGAGAVKKP